VNPDVVKHTEKVAPIAAAASALATLVCCLPIGFAASAATASLGAFIAPLRPWFLGASLVLLAIGAVEISRNRRTCATTGRARATSLAILILSAFVILLVTLLPQVVAGILADWMP
jgi:hypothetical protein